MNQKQIVTAAAAILAGQEPPHDGAAVAAAAAAGAVNQLLEANRSAAIAQRDHERFKHAAAIAKAVLNPPLVLMLMLYPSVMGFTMAARYTKFSLLIPTPQAPGTAPGSAVGGPDDEWVTKNPQALWCTAASFTAVLLIHLYLVTNLTLKKDEAEPKMTARYAWVAPMIFWAATSLYFWVYTSVARYGVANVEWVIAACASTCVLAVTLLALCVSAKLNNVVKGLPLPPIAPPNNV